MLPFHLLHIFSLKCSLLRGDLQEAMEQSLKQKLQPGCSIQGNYQSEILLLGIKPSSRIGKEKRGEKSNAKPFHYGDFIDNMS